MAMKCVTLRGLIGPLFALLLSTAPAWSQSAVTVPPPRTQFLNTNGQPLSGGSVNTFIPNTTTCKTTWQDYNQTTPNACPVILDSAGSALIFGSGEYLIQVFDSSSNLIWSGNVAAAGTQAAASIGVGSTAVTGGNTGRVLFDSSGSLGEYTITGSAGSVVLSTSPTITTPTIAGTTAATSPTTGTLIVGTAQGGLGVAGDIIAGGTAAGIGVSNSQNTTSQVFVKNANAGASAISQFFASNTNVANATGAIGVSGGAAPTGFANWGSGITTTNLQMNGTSVLALTKSGGVQVGAPTGGDKGVGTVNAAGIYYSAGNPFGKVLLATLTASNSANLTDVGNCGTGGTTGCFTATYNQYEIEFINVVPAAGAGTMQLLVHTGGTFPVSSYLASVNTLSNGTNTAAAEATANIPLSAANVNTTAFSGFIRVYGPSNSAQSKLWTGQSSYLTSTPHAVIATFGGAYNGAATALDGFEFLNSAGNLTSGTVKVYGLF